MPGRRAILAALLVMLASGVSPAHACITTATLNLSDIKYADVVVMGRITDYSADSGTVTRYARFNIQVDEILVGEAPAILAVTWDNSTYAEPETMPAGPYLIALRDPRSPPILSPSATILPNPEPRSLTVLQSPCASPFIFLSESAEAITVRRMLQR